KKISASSPGRLRYPNLILLAVRKNHARTEARRTRCICFPYQPYEHDTRIDERTNSADLLWCYCRLECGRWKPGENHRVSAGRQLRQPGVDANARHEECTAFNARWAIRTT